MAFKINKSVFWFLEINVKNLILDSGDSYLAKSIAKKFGMKFLGVSEML
jgi:hypothetical protein